MTTDDSKMITDYRLDDWLTTNGSKMTTNEGKGQGR